jgi:hypothetical protein
VPLKGSIFWFGSQLQMADGKVILKNAKDGAEARKKTKVK